EVMAPVRMGLVCLRHVPPELAGDETALARHNAAILARVNATGKVFLSHAMLGDRYVIRVAIGSMRTDRQHVDLAWRLLSERRIGSV
ncbi:MAG TPA: amino acid decarboxylase, partial [Gemmatimonadales bacterium]|nr:amino acid decarboxylase [Gemmatimonadales bacterium]